MLVRLENPEIRLSIFNVSDTTEWGTLFAQESVNGSLQRPARVNRHLIEAVSCRPTPKVQVNVSCKKSTGKPPRLSGVSILCTMPQP